jgi:hypothetical protein
MTPFQFILLAIAAFITLTSFDLKPLFSAIKSKLSSIKVPDKIDFPTEVVGADEDNLIDVVKKWDALKDACEAQGLTEAVSKLNEIFPVLIKVEDKKGDA